VIVTDASGRLHLHEDPAANLVLITDDNSTPAERYQYDAFGDPTILNGDGDLVLPASAVDQGPRFGGMPYLGGPGLFAAGARHYDPITGVFLARDPNLHADSPSPYAYCGHNPVGRIDPDGALWGPLLFGVFGAAANVIGLWRSGADFDAWDVLAAGAIGFGAGFVGAATFGRAAAGITRGLLSVAGRAPVALGGQDLDRHQRRQRRGRGTGQRRRERQPRWSCRGRLRRHAWWRRRVGPRQLRRRPRGRRRHGSGPRGRRPVPGQPACRGDPARHVGVA
jgi:RHS repeat-associated protein